MRKTTDKKSGAVTFHWTSDRNLTRQENLQLEIDKLKKKIEDLSRYLDWYKWNYERSEKEYKGRLEKIEDLKSFIDLLEESLFKETHPVEKEISGKTCVLVYYSDCCRVKMEFQKLVEEYNIDSSQYKIVYRNQSNVDQGVLTVESPGRYIDFKIEEGDSK